MTEPERELRQYRLMHACLSGFLAGALGIDETISDLEGLLLALEAASEDWRQAFQDELETLEAFDAIALDHGDLLRPDASVPALRQAAENMLAIVDSEIERAAG